MHKEILQCISFTEKRLKTLRQELGNALSNKSYAVVTGGSYARREASEQSDLDWFIICDSAEAKKQGERDLKKISGLVKKVVNADPAEDGAFGRIETIGEMIKNIGGKNDGNFKITRRILLLLEGEWLYDQSRFMDYRSQILGRYIRPTISDHQFCRFLLNDLIRYYRTICVDFEHKTTEAGKEWGIRNLKLVFSRKLLYFSGVLVAAESWQHSFATKDQKIKHLLALSPIGRIHEVCGARAEPALNAYGVFLGKMADPSIRAMAKKVTEIKDEHPEEFRLFKNEGHHFSWMLTKLLKDTYDTSHPIHNALIV